MFVFGAYKCLSQDECLDGASYKQDRIRLVSRLPPRVRSVAYN
jgi:hypothetical protein